ncbi:hypothetical protein LUZ63_007791 [Rhynchospora breviuscula]|uniref:Zinc finger MYM-type protein 1-like n=1 Tax=Rhynchospora breviuscula TaxID=2022672 RepID=A0A9Q0CSC1_9POAL|nr:hypothetical protein LUZ63_007791 [Rhynchospora breviuscula]
MKLVAPPIQKDIIKAAAIETTNKIMEELGDDLFSVLVDESRDVSCKEQMAVLLRYVSKQGSIVERFLAVVHVKETTSMSLKESLEELFCRHKLSFSRLRGQGYDGASNMRGEFNGLKALILNENSSAYYVHCFAHQLQFTEANTELLRCMSCLHPRSNFCAFDKVHLIELARFYPNDFSNSELSILETQLDCYIQDLCTDQDFSQLNGMSDLSQKLVAKRKDIIYPLVYKLIKLALIFPVATASVERAFSAMKIVKTRLRNKMGDEFLNDNLVTYIEKEVFRQVSNEAIMQRFQTMKTRKGVLIALEN